MPNSLADRLRSAVAAMPDPKPQAADLAKIAGVKAPSVSQWFSGRTKSLGKALLPIARFLNVNPEWLNSGRGPMRPDGNASDSSYRVTDDSSTYGFEISLLDARGSCGGGSLAWEMEERPPLVKEPSWFRRYAVRADDLTAVFADGDSMADYIVDGDIVIFDTSKTDPQSGQIFLIDHPDGLKIKKLRREIDGAWLLESLNPDKRRYPDEKITEDQAELLRIRGRFVYRQGG